MSPLVVLWLIIALSSLAQCQDIITYKASMVWPGLDTIFQSNNNRREIVTDRNVSSKFIILTTGDQIKLYPLVPDTQGSADLVPAENYYLLTTKKAKSKDSKELTKKLGNNPMSQLLSSRRTSREASIEDQTIDRESASNKEKESIINDEDEFYYYNNDYLKNFNWKEPWIVDVDYFFDADFCFSFNSQDEIIKPTDCLVIVWLDKNNKVIRYGSINLAKNPIETLASSTRRTNKDLLLSEFTPVSIVNQSKETQYESQVYAMVMDKRRAKLYVAYSDGSAPYANRILSGYLRTTSPIDYYPSSPESQLIGETTLKFNECLIKPSSGDETSFENLFIDEVNGDWLFYFDKYQGGKIFALNSRWTTIFKEQSNDSNDLSSHFNSLQALVKDIPLDAWQENAELGKINKNATGMAMDPKRRLLYWLNEDNEIHSCDYAGSNAKLVDRLSSKPVIRSPHTMQVSQDTLYISDPIKNTLIAYKLGSSDHHGKDDDEIQKYRDGTNRPLDMIRSTHQVLLVEIPTIYGFRVVNIEEFNKTLVGKGVEFSIDRRVPLNEGFSNANSKLESGLAGEQEGRDIIQLGSTETRSIESYLLFDRSFTKSQCGYDQSRPTMHTRLMDDGMFVFLIQLGLLPFCFLALWFLFLKLNQMIVKARENKLTAIANLNCPV